jgi:hypothetical protein
MKPFRRLAKILRPWIATAVIKGFLPETIGRYRTLDILLVWMEEDATH